MDPLRILGLQEGADAVAIRAARRRLARRAHPDVGGSVAEMQRLNQAAAAALAALAAERAAAGPPAPGRTPRRPTRSTPRQPVYDHPSFTVEAVIGEAFAGLAVVATWLGEEIDAEPPYRLEVALGPPIRGWCRLDLVHDAGSTAVSLAVAAEPGYPIPDLDAVRNAWIDGLNTLDWSGPGGPLAP